MYIGRKMIVRKSNRYYFRIALFRLSFIRLFFHYYRLFIRRRKSCVTPVIERPGFYAISRNTILRVFRAIKFNIETLFLHSRYSLRVAGFYKLST